MQFCLAIQPFLLQVEPHLNSRPIQHYLGLVLELPLGHPWHKHPPSHSIPHSNSNPMPKCRPSQTWARQEQWVLVGQNDRWMIQAVMLEELAGRVVRVTIVHPWMEQGGQVRHPLSPVRLHHPMRIDQLGLWEELQGDRGALHPSAVPRAVQGVPRAVQEGLREDLEVKQEGPVGDPAGPHPLVELQVAREGLRGGRAVKPEGLVAMKGESHWGEALGERRMHPEEGRTQAGLER